MSNFQELFFWGLESKIEQLGNNLEVTTRFLEKFGISTFFQQWFHKNAGNLSPGEVVLVLGKEAPKNPALEFDFRMVLYIEKTVQP